LPRFRLTLAYDGAGFAGWQSQAGGQRAVQSVLEDALGRLAGGERVAVAGAGRTDAGVHALGQVASFDLPRPIAAPALLRALNGLLPPDLRVLQAAEVGEGFHARKSAVSKLYRYLLDTGPLRLPQRRGSAGHVPYPLDEDAVHALAALYVGRRDFAALASTGSSVKTTVRTVGRSAASFVDIEGLPGHRALVYEVEADGFLRKMVRSMVGGLVACGRGMRGLDELRDALQAGDRSAWPAPAEACGLTLVRVDYPADESD
jgi:tRNA pseudouridine38-40 synthase